MMSRLSVMMFLQFFAWGAWFATLGLAMMQNIIYPFLYAIGVLSCVYHLANGIRHLLWDAGWGFELGTAYTTGWLVVIASIVLTIVSWLGGYAALGGI